MLQTTQGIRHLLIIIAWGSSPLDILLYFGGKKKKKKKNLCLVALFFYPDIFLSFFRPKENIKKFSSFKFEFD
jgi:hypothetical protein